MKKEALLIIILATFPLTSIFAFGIPGLPSFFGSTVVGYGGKITDVNSCRCPTEEPEKLGLKQIVFSPFYKGAKRQDGTALFYDTLGTKLYDHQKMSSGVWNTGKYKPEHVSCKYITAQDLAEAAAKAAAGAPMPPKCSGTYEGDGTIDYTGTSKGGGFFSFGF